MASATSAIRDEIRDLDKQITQAQKRKGDLEQALKLIDGSSTRRASSARTRSASKKSTGTRKRRSTRRASRGQRRDQVLAAVTGGAKRPSEIAKQVGVSSSQVSALLRSLSDEGHLKKSNNGDWTAR